MKKLIAYYSRAGENYFSGAHRAIAVGNTEQAARLLAELTGAELFHIEQKVPYSDDYDTCVAEVRRDLRANARPELTALPESLDDYDEIYLGYPNYCGTMPMAVYTFLEHYDWQGKTIHPFCTNEGSGLSNTGRTSGGLRRARGSRTACRCAAVRSRVQNRSWSNGCTDNERFPSGREGGGRA